MTYSLKPAIAIIAVMAAFVAWNEYKDYERRERRREADAWVAQANEKLYRWAENEMAEDRERFRKLREAGLATRKKSR